MADALVTAIYEQSKSFSKEELYGLTSQMPRAAVPVPANIAEGASRQHKKDYLNYLYNARGSLAELEYYIELAGRFNFIAAKGHEQISATHGEASRTLVGLIQSVEAEARICEPGVATYGQ